MPLRIREGIAPKNVAIHSEQDSDPTLRATHKETAMKFAGSIAATLSWLLALASVSIAATNPLNYPTGIALDPKGNLRVEY
jgi:hypothetical protein